MRRFRLASGGWRWARREAPDARRPAAMRGRRSPASGRFDPIDPIDEVDKVGLAIVPLRVSEAFEATRGPRRFRLASCGWRRARREAPDARRPAAVRGSQPPASGRFDTVDAIDEVDKVGIASFRFAFPRPLRSRAGCGVFVWRLAIGVWPGARRQTQDDRPRCGEACPRRAAGSTQSTQSTKSTKSGSPRSALRFRGRSGGGRAAANAASPPELQRPCAWLQIVPRPKRVRSGSMAQPSMPSSAQAA